MVNTVATLLEFGHQQSSDDETNSIFSSSTITSYSSFSMGSEFDGIFDEMSHFKPHINEGRGYQNIFRKAPLDIDGIHREHYPVHMSFLRVRDLLANPQSDLNSLLDLFDEDLDYSNRSSDLYAGNAKSEVFTRCNTFISSPRGSGSELNSFADEKNLCKERQDSSEILHGPKPSSALIGSVIQFGPRDSNVYEPCRSNGRVTNCKKLTDRPMNWNHSGNEQVPQVVGKIRRRNSTGCESISQGTNRRVVSQPRRSSIGFQVETVSPDSAPRKPKRRDSFSSISGSVQCRAVKFNQVGIRKYDCILGDSNPAMPGPSIGIGWKYETQTPVHIDDWERERAGCRRQPHELLMSRSKRENIAKNILCSSMEVTEKGAANKLEGTGQNSRGRRLEHWTGITAKPERHRSDIV